MIDKKDILILKELDINSRQSNAQIARKVKLGKDTINYRIKKLEEKGIITGYFPLVNYFKLGKQMIKLLIKFNNLGEKGEKNLAVFFQKYDQVVWFARTEGHYDLIVTIRFNDLKEIYKILEELKNNFPTNIKENKILLSPSFEFLSEKYLYEEGEKGYSNKAEITDKQEVIDEKDLKIISELEDNARKPIINIAEKIKITPEAILVRIKKLKQKEIIQHYKVRINFEKLEYNYHHILISLKDYSKLEDIKEYYRQSKHCTFMMNYEGAYDFHLEWVTKHGEFRAKINELRERFGDFISDYKSITIFDEYKIL